MMMMMIMIHEKALLNPTTYSFIRPREAKLIESGALTTKRNSVRISAMRKYITKVNKLTYYKNNQSSLAVTYLCSVTDVGLTTYFIVY